MKWIAAMMVLWACMACMGPAGPAGEAPTTEEIVEALLRSPEMNKAIQRAVDNSTVLRSASTPAPRKPDPTLKPNTSSDAPPPKLNCEASCKTYGTCTLREGRCTTVSSAECARSMGCRMLGNCTFFPDEKNVYTRCRPGSEDDCKKSESCQKSGKCTFRARQCVK